jgi:hypothetical protein
MDQVSKPWYSFEYLRQAWNQTQRHASAPRDGERESTTPHRDDSAEHFARSRVDNADARDRHQRVCPVDEVGDELAARVYHQRDVPSAQLALVPALDVQLIAAEHEWPQTRATGSQPHALARRECSE